MHTSISFSCIHLLSWQLNLTKCFSQKTASTTEIFLYRFRLSSLSATNFSKKFNFGNYLTAPLTASACKNLQTVAHAVSPIWLKFSGLVGLWKYENHPKDFFQVPAVLEIWPSKVRIALFSVFGPLFVQIATDWAEICHTGHKQLHMPSVQTAMKCSQR